MSAARQSTRETTPQVIITGHSMGAAIATITTSLMQQLAKSKKAADLLRGLDGYLNTNELATDPPKQS